MKLINNLKTKKISKKIKSIFFMLLGFMLLIKQSLAVDRININDIIPDETWTVINIREGERSVSSILWFARDSILWLLALITIAVFIFLWARLIIARWNAEELKKVLMQFVYVVIWLAIIALSWAAVKLVSSLNF